MTIDPIAPVRVYRHLKISVEQAFDAWLDPKKIAKWMTASAGDKSLAVKTNGLQGTHFSFVNLREGSSINHVGEYIEVRRPHRLVFTWGVEGYPMGASRVAVDFEPNGAETYLTLTHRGVDQGYKERTQRGWETIITGLEESVTAKK